MKSFIVAICILLILLVGLWFYNSTLKTIGYENIEKLEVIYSLIEEDKWDESGDVFLVFREEYQKKERIMKALVDHAEMDSIESSLIATEEFIKTRSKPDALDAVARAIFLIKHIEEKNRFSVENVL